ncbi:two-component system LytT family response regulator [Dokdonella fugitiva]|uniref:Two-component system LytT family response regulator n=1 Tax=Dokdonella fugitiva TaxID=328517 RepID=A0A839F819_9GAMM|nr:LytTR family DNA-binding domain-containing protein [Dokdonella fugitiva]MBA8888301.1 two-component system LytT family response regulator [Dokdonella fugitiva]
MIDPVVTRFRVASVDDEPRAHEALRALLADVGDIDLVATYTSAHAAAAGLAACPCDLLFLDVAMPRMDGLALLRTLADPPVTVLLTAHVDHAMAAFDLGVRDYLLKPVSAERLQRCLERIRPLLLAARDGAGRAPARLSIKCGTAHRLIDPARTTHIDADGNFTVVHAGGEAIFASEPMKDLERRLAPFGFVRVHKSHLVNTRAIRATRAYDLVLDDGSTVPTGRAYRAALDQRIGR